MFDDDRSFAGFVSGLYPDLFAYAMGILLERHGAEDVCQEVFLRAHEMGDRFMGMQHRRAYLYTMVRNRCMDHFRSGQNRLEVPLTEGATLSAVFTPEREALRNELDQVIMAGLATLDLERREVLLLRDVQGLSYKEVAALSGTTVTRVRWVLREARQHLKQYVEAKYGGD